LLVLQINQRYNASSRDQDSKNDCGKIQKRTGPKFLRLEKGVIKRKEYIKALRGLPGDDLESDKSWAERKPLANCPIKGAEANLPPC